LPLTIQCTCRPEEKQGVRRTIDLHARILYHRGPEMKRKTVIVALGALLVIFIAAQFIRPDRTNPHADPALVITAQLPVPGEIQAILHNSCFDCHSNETRWPWYSQIAPVSWFVADDVAEGRRHLNFSLWGTYKESRRIDRLDAMVREVDRGGMPLPSYLAMHRAARMDDSTRDYFCNWAEHTSDSLSAGR
jgi:hypothetical protein